MKMNILVIGLVLVILPACSGRNWGALSSGSPSQARNFASSSSGPQIYIAQNATGAANGSDCNDAYSGAWFNNAANWSENGGPIGPGVTVHICGVWTSSAQAGNALTIQGSGAAGNPVTIVFEAGAQLNSTGWWGATQQASGACGKSNPSLCYGAITAIGQSDITIDGGSNGIIQNLSSGCVQGAANQGGGTANCLNGVSATCSSGPCTQTPGHTGSLGVLLDGDNLIVKNLTIQNIYRSTGSDPSVTDANGLGSGGIDVIEDSTNIQVAGNTVNNAYYGIASGSGNTSGPNGCPNEGVCIYDNSISDHDWQMATGTSTTGGTINIYGNTIGDGPNLPGWSNWQYPTWAYHTDGIISFGSPGYEVINYIYNNYFQGDLGQGSPTGMIYCTHTTNQDGSGCGATIFNNVFVGIGGTTVGDAIIFIPTTDVSDNYTMGTVAIYNNTFINGGNSIFIDNSENESLNLIVENNLFSPTTNYPGGYFISQGNGGTAWTSLTMDHNLYWNDRGSLFNIGSSWNAGRAGDPPTAAQNFALWQTTCGCDAHSIYANPNLTSNYLLSGNSPAIGLGQDLSQVGINSLDSDANGVSRYPAWDAGAYQDGSGSGVSPTPTPIISAAPAPNPTPAPAPTTPPTPPTPPTSPANTSSYRGCYADSSDRTLPQQLNISPVTVESCVQAAQSAGYAYAGVQYGSQCFAGNAMPSLSSSNCNMPCNGNTNEICGGTWANSIYSVSASSGAGSSTGSSSNPTSSTSPSPSSNSSSWTLCSNENGQCNFSGTMVVQYGSYDNGQFTYQVLNDGTACNNSVFGDPDYGYPKQCWYFPLSP